MPNNCYYYACNADRQYYPPTSEIVDQLTRLVRTIEEYRCDGHIYYSKRCVD